MAPFKALLQCALSCLKPKLASGTSNSVESSTSSTLYPPYPPTAPVNRVSESTDTSSQSDCAQRGANVVVDEVGDVLTLFSQGGDVIFQNIASKNYHGDITKKQRQRNSAELPFFSHPAFDRLFALEPSQKADLVTTIRSGGSWTQIVRVPCSAVEVPASKDTSAPEPTCIIPSPGPGHASVPNTKLEFTIHESQTIPAMPEGTCARLSMPSSRRQCSAPLVFASREDYDPPRSGGCMRSGDSMTSRSQLATVMQATGSKNTCPRTLSVLTSLTYVAPDAASPSSGKVRSLDVEADDPRNSVPVSPRGIEGSAAPESGLPTEAEEGVSALPPIPDDCMHEITARLVPNPSGPGKALLVMQSDVTSRSAMYSVLTALSEAQLAMLANIFPRHVVDFLATVGENHVPGQMGQLARCHEQVTILFMDIVGFTSMSEAVAPSIVMNFLNELFTMFDNLVDHHNIQKVETAGDCYIVAGGILEADGEGFYKVKDSPDPKDSASRVMAFAKDMLRCSREVHMPHNGEVVSIRIGMHTGPCVSGLVGTKLPKFSIFGDTMNTASRMESTCKPGHIQVSAATHNLMSDTEVWRPTGGLQIKGKGQMETMLWVQPEDFFARPVNPAAFVGSEAAAASAADNVAAVSSSVLSGCLAVAGRTSEHMSSAHVSSTVLAMAGMLATNQRAPRRAATSGLSGTHHSGTQFPMCNDNVSANGLKGMAHLASVMMGMMSGHGSSSNAAPKPSQPPPCKAESNSKLCTADHVGNEAVQLVHLVSGVSGVDNPLHESTRNANSISPNLLLLCRVSAQLKARQSGEIRRSLELRQRIKSSYGSFLE